MISLTFPIHSSPTLVQSIALAAIFGFYACRSTPSPRASSSPSPIQSKVTADEPSHAACSAALLCDDFERHPLGAVPGPPFRNATANSGASVRVSNTRAFSGSRSVHILAPGGASYRRGYFAIHGAPVFPTAGREMYGRILVFLKEAPLTPKDKPPVHWTFIQGEGRSANDTYNSLYRYGGQHQGGTGLMANFETTPPIQTDCWQHSASRLPVQQWSCVEWHFVAATNEMQFWLDGEEIVDLRVKEQGKGPASGCLGDDLNGLWSGPPAFQSLYLGWEHYQEPENTPEIWIDDVAVSLQRIGCPSQTSK